MRNSGFYSKGWLFLSDLDFSQIKIFNDVLQELNFNFSVRSASDIYAVIEKLTSPGISYHDFLCDVSGQYGFEEIVGVDMDYCVLAGILRNVMTDFPEVRQLLSTAENIVSGSSTEFISNYRTRLSTSMRFVENVPFYVMSILGPQTISKSKATLNQYGLLQGSNSIMQKLGNTLLMTLSPYYLATSLINKFKYPYLNKKCRLFITLITKHLDWAQGRSWTLDIAKDYCLHLIKIADSEETRGNSASDLGKMKVSKIFVLLISYLVVTSESVSFDSNLLLNSLLELYYPKTKLAGCCIKDFIIGEMTRSVPVSKLKLLETYAEELIDFLYGINVDAVTARRYADLSSEIVKYSGKRLLLDYMFPYSKIDDQTFCKCDDKSLHGILTCLYFELHHLLSRDHCSNRFNVDSFDVIQDESGIWFPGKEEIVEKDVEIAAVDREPFKISENWEHDERVIRHDIIPMFELVSTDIRHNNLEEAIKKITALKNWFQNYFLGFGTNDRSEEVNVLLLLKERFSEKFHVEVSASLARDVSCVRIYKEKFVAHVVENLIRNFEEHAFVGMGKEDTKTVQLSAGESDRWLEIRISNNGAAFTSDITPDNVFQLGVSEIRRADAGTGCWAMKKFMQLQGGDIRVEQNHSNFPVVFVLTFDKLKSDSKS